MKARKLVAVFLAVGYLTDLQCRVACAFPPSLNAAVHQSDDGCHHENQESDEPGSKAPCCMSHVGGAVPLLPSAAPSLAPRIIADLATILPPVVAVMPRRLLALTQDHGPPRSVTDLLSQSSLSPRAPPAAVL